jgi:hypothetical protein
VSQTVAQTATEARIRAHLAAFGPAVGPAAARIFTPDDLAACGSVARSEAPGILRDFAAAGVVERVPEAYRLTPYGSKLAADFAATEERS